MLIQGWRWFGPKDPVSLDDIRQAGAREIVSALHDVPIGEAWTRRAVAERKTLIETAPAGRSPLAWTVVESIPIPDDVKRHGAGATRSIEAWVESLKAVAANDIRIICYNFMPVVDWARTDLDWPLPTGATALRFDNDRFAAFELHILERPGAENDFDAGTRAKARALYQAMGPDDIAYLIKVIASALPGSTTEPLTIPAFRERLALYRGIGAAQLRQHLIEFLGIVTPVAESLGVRLTLHPDDPPRPRGVGPAGGGEPGTEKLVHRRGRGRGRRRRHERQDHGDRHDERHCGEPGQGHDPRHDRGPRLGQQALEKQPARSQGCDHGRAASVKTKGFHPWINVRRTFSTASEGWLLGLGHGSARGASVGRGGCAKPMVAAGTITASSMILIFRQSAGTATSCRPPAGQSTTSVAATAAPAAAGRTRCSRRSPCER
jgi:hypothetical protein